MSVGESMQPHSTNSAHATPRIPAPVKGDRIAEPPANPKPEVVDWSKSMISPRPIDRESSWQRAYRRKLVISDAVIALVMALLAFAIRFGTDPTHLELRMYSVFAAVLPFAWVGALLASRTYEHRFLGVGSEEYRRVMVAALILVATVASLSFGFKLELARGFVLVALPAMGVVTVVTRYAHRKHLHNSRARGQAMSKVVVVGHQSGVEALVRQVRTTPYHGLDVIGACTPHGDDKDGFLTRCDVPVLGNFDSVVDAVKQTGAHAVAVMPCPEMDGPTIRRLGWDLEATAADMLVAPAVVEVVGPRIHIRPVCGLPLLHVERPELEGLHRWVKGVFDRTTSVAALVCLLPIFLTIAAIIRLTSRGPALFKQVRVGRHGKEFTMYKFRTMVVNADALVGSLSQQNEGAGVLFKMKRDPRITGIGAFLRRYSLDELPQLLNVAKGDMSLVGPRPPLPREVAEYGNDMRRRLLVKPGLTGLWQINGRSDLSWDESVRLDLRYVENWSFAFDFMIIWKTIGAVLAKRGAY